MSFFNKILILIVFNIKKKLRLKTYRYLLLDSNTHELISETSLKEIPKKIKIKNTLYDVLTHYHEILDDNNIVVFIYITVNKNDL